MSQGQGGGRPEKYTQEWLEKESEAFLEWMKGPKNVFFKGFAVERGYAPSQLNDFADKSQKFSLALKQAKEIQEFKLAHMGFFCEHNANPGMAKFALACNHGWKEPESNASVKYIPVMDTAEYLKSKKADE